MRYVELICRAARAAHDEQVGIGVRLSPVRLSAEEAAELATIARAVLGPKVYVAVAAPGVDPWEDERTCLAPGERAAERATAWRNLVNPAEGDWILYVSVERLGRAGGLHDTLRAIDEGALRRTLLQGAGDAPSAIPDELARALQGSGVADRAPTQALCALHEAVSAAPLELRWEAAGRSLPLLGLAADSRLRERPEERLKGNLRWVQEAGAREGRGGPGKQPLKGELAAAISGGAREEALRTVDLGNVKTDELSPPPKTRKKRLPSAGSSVSAAPALKPKASVAAARRAPPAAQPAPPLSVSDAPPDERFAEEPDSAQLETRLDAGDAAEPPALDGRRGEPTVPKRPVVEPLSGPTTPASPSQLPLQPKAKTLKAAPWEGRQISGPTAALVEIALKGAGEGLCWELRGVSPRSALERPPAGFPRPRRLDLAASDERVLEAVAEWSAARARLLQALGGLGLDAARLARAPALPNAALETAVETAQAFIEAASTAITILLERAPGALPVALARDTICLHCPVRDEALLLLTPIHPLVVGAALARADIWHQARHVPTDERGPILRALSRGTPAPPRWPAPVGGALRAAASLEGLPVYETRPTSIAEGTLADAAEALTLRFLELHPHARLGLKVMIDAENCGPLVEGVAEAILSEAEAAPRVTVFAPGVPALSERAGVVVTEGRLTLAPLPSATDERAALAPHLEILVPPPGSARIVSSPTPPVSGPLPRAARRAVEGGWEICTPAHAVVGGAIVEAAVGVALNEPAQGAFITHISAPAISNATPADRGTWRAVLAPQLGAAPRVGPLVLVNEHLPGARLAVLSQDVRAVGRAMTDSFRAVGVRDTRPNVIESLVKQLARSTGGALPLEGPALRGLVARMLERVVADGLGEGAVVTQVLDEDLRAIQPEIRGVAFPVVVGASLVRALRVTIGVALADLPLDAALPDAALDLVTRVGAWALRAGRPEKLAGAAARDLLAELLWPRLAAMAPRGEALGWLLEGATATDVSVDAVALVPAGHGLAGKPGVRVGDLGLEVVALDHTLVQRVVLGAG